MTEATTTFEEEYSDPDGRAASGAATRRVMAAAELFGISAVGADGRPHVTPLAAVWTEGALRVCTGLCADVVERA